MQQRPRTLQQKLKLLAWVCGALLGIEGYNRGISRLLRALKRGVTAAILTWMEERGGLKLFTLEGEELLEPPSITRMRTFLELPPAEEITTTPINNSPTINVPGSLEANGITSSSGTNEKDILTSAKLFAALGLEDSEALLALTMRRVLSPNELLFKTGDASNGAYIVIKGALGVFLDKHRDDHHASSVAGDGRSQSSSAGGLAAPLNGGCVYNNDSTPASTSSSCTRISTLHFGESVGDMDLLDGAPRSVTCKAMEAGCTLIHLTGDVWLDFIRQRPKTLQRYLQGVIARLWRVGHFALVDFLQLDVQHLTTLSPGLKQSNSTIPMLKKLQAAKPLDARETATLAAAVQLTALQNSVHNGPEDVNTMNINTTAAMNLMLNNDNTNNGVAQISTPPPSPGFKSVLVTSPPSSASSPFKQDAQHIGRQQQQTVANIPSPSRFSRFMQPLQGILRTSKPTSDMRKRSVSFSKNLEQAATNDVGAQRNNNSNLSQVVYGDAAAGSNIGVSNIGVRRRSLENLSTMLVQTRQACLLGGWDVVAPEECGLSLATVALLSIPTPPVGKRITLQPGITLIDIDQVAREFFIVLEGCALIQRALPNGTHSETALIAAGSLINGAAFLSGTRTRAKVSAAGVCTLVAFSSSEIERLLNLSSSSSSSVEGNNKQDQGDVVTTSKEGREEIKRQASTNDESQSEGNGGSREGSNNPTPIPPSDSPSPPVSVPIATTTRTAALESQESPFGTPEQQSRRLLPVDIKSELAKILSQSPSNTSSSDRDFVDFNRCESRESLYISAAASLSSSSYSSQGSSPLMNEPLLGSAEMDTLLDSDNSSVLPLPTTEGSLPTIEERINMMDKSGSSEFNTDEASKEPVAIDKENDEAEVFSTKPSDEKPSSVMELDGFDVGAVAVDLLLAAAKALGPVIRSFVSLGLSRKWLRGGQILYRQGEPAQALYILISGRTRMLHRDHRGMIRIEEDVTRGQSFGGVWTVTKGCHDATCICIRDAEMVRMSRAAFDRLSSSRPRAVARILQGMAQRLAAAKSSRGPADTLALSSSAAYPCETVTIAILPAGTPKCSRNSSSMSADDNGHEARRLFYAQQQHDLDTVARVLKSNLEASFGSTTLLDFATVKLMFPIESQALHVGFHRSKLTSWVSQMEEDCRFILLVGSATSCPTDTSADTSLNNTSGSSSSSSTEAGTIEWNNICGGQADCTLLVASPATSNPEVSPEEKALVWDGVEEAWDFLQQTATATGGQLLSKKLESINRAWSALALNPVASSSEHTLAEVAGGGADDEDNNDGRNPLRRVELVLLHPEGTAPRDTCKWLDSRPLLQRHHHVRCSPRHSTGDFARLARWMADSAIGVVLSGGGSRGLAHLGVLKALDDAGVPIDVVGGTSQGAFMAGLYAQSIGWNGMQATVRQYAQSMGSIGYLVRDLTLPLLSVFSGASFNSLVKDSFQRGAQRIEDLPISFFCVTTNLSRGAPQYHDKGTLWRAVRASMTIVGLVPPVIDEDGQLHCDGGYADNIPAGHMRRLGVKSVIIVDVEDRDQSAWMGLQPTDGGISGWQLLWDRWCPVPNWRFNIKMPGHPALMNALTWMSHLQNLRRVARENRIDLYLRPPVSQYRLLDYRMMDRIVRESLQYAFVAVTDWQRRVVHSQGALAPGVAAAMNNQQKATPIPSGSSTSATGTNNVGGGLVMTTSPSLPLPITAARSENTAAGHVSQSPHLKCRSRSIACMTQLQAKQDAAAASSSPFSGLLAGSGEMVEDSSEGDGAAVEEIPAPLLIQRASTLPGVLNDDSGLLGINSSLQQQQPMSALQKQYSLQENAAIASKTLPSSHDDVVVLPDEEQSRTGSRSSSVNAVVIGGFNGNTNTSSSSKTSSNNNKNTEEEESKVAPMIPMTTNLRPHHQQYPLGKTLSAAEAARAILDRVPSGDDCHSRTDYPWSPTSTSAAPVVTLDPSSDQQDKEAEEVEDEEEVLSPFSGTISFAGWAANGDPIPGNGATFGGKDGDIRNTTGASDIDHHEDHPPVGWRQISSMMRQLDDEAYKYLENVEIEFDDEDFPF